MQTPSSLFIISYLSEAVTGASPASFVSGVAANFPPSAAEISGVSVELTAFSDGVVLLSGGRSSQYWRLVEVLI